MDTLLQTAVQVFLEDRYATEATGIGIVAVEDHYARCALSLTNAHRNARGAVMGGVFGTMADFAFAIAANTESLSSGDTMLHWVSLESTIHYLAQPKGDRIEAETHLLRLGRTTCLFEVNLFEPAAPQRRLAHVLVSGSRV